MPPSVLDASTTRFATEITTLAICQSKLPQQRQTAIPNTFGDGSLPAKGEVLSSPPRIVPSWNRSAKQDFPNRFFLTCSMHVFQN